MYLYTFIDYSNVDTRADDRGSNGDGENGGDSGRNNSLSTKEEKLPGKQDKQCENQSGHPSSRLDMMVDRIIQLQSTKSTDILLFYKETSFGAYSMIHIKLG